MKKVSMVLLFALVTMVSYSQTTIGGIGSINFRSSFDANYGGWVDFGNWGIDFMNGATLSNESPMSYIYGNSKKYTAGSTYQNYGVHKSYRGLDNNYYSYGGGIQNLTDITTSGNENSVLPYVIFGMGHRFSNDTYFMKGQVIVSKITSVGFGFGIILK